MNKWTYWLMPIENVYRIREEINGGLNHRIVGIVNTEADAKLICDSVNAARGEDE